MAGTAPPNGLVRAPCAALCGLKLASTLMGLKVRTGPHPQGDIPGDSRMSGEGRKSVSGTRGKAGTGPPGRQSEAQCTAAPGRPLAPPPTCTGLQPWMVECSPCMPGL